MSRAEPQSPKQQQDRGLERCARFPDLDVAVDARVVVHMNPFLLALIPE